MKVSLLLFILALGSYAQAQNLVPNPSFENYINCPAALSEIPYSNTYSGFKSVSNWSNSVLGASPDYFNSCVPWPGPSVPQNSQGFQQSKTGDAYVGIIAYNAFSSPSFPYKYVAEYVYCKLNSKLLAGKVYDISFYVSGTLRGGSTSIYAAIDRIGAHLSDTIAYDLTSRRLIVPYHIKSTAGILLDDTASWMLVSGSYVAKGGEEYLFVGNFDDDSPINVKHYNPNIPSQSFFSYYYIDDVSVKLVPCDTFNSVSDTTLCNNEFIILSSSIDNADSYTWQQGQGNKSINVYQPGTYWVMATKDTCDLYIDTFHVSNSLDTVISSFDTIVCQQDGFKITLTSSASGAALYNWNNGKSSASIDVVDTGFYLCTTIKDCTIYIDSFSLRQKTLPKIPSLHNDTTICKDVVYTIGQPINESIVYKWNTGATTCCIDVTHDGNYALTITNGCTSVSDDINIQFFECIDCIWAPTAFTPNNDGKNDFFKVFSKCPLQEYRLVVVNRWGEQIFASNNVSDSWDGKHNNIDVPVGSYYFLITYRSLLSNKTEVLKSDVTLIR